MNFQVKFISFCIAICAAALSSVKANNNLREGEACLVQYLHNKGKLSQEFRSLQPASSQCRLVTPLTTQIIKSTVEDTIQKEIQDDADCLIEQFGNKGTVDYLIKIAVLDINGMISESDRQAELVATRNDLRKELKDIADQCETDTENFINLFNENLGIKNESLAVVQHEYCLAKYVADNKIIVVGNVEINPKQIDPNSVDCDGIVEAERRKNEKEISDKIAATGKRPSVLSCVINYYRTNKMYDSIVGLNVLSKLDFSRETKEIETNRLTENVGQFALAIYRCSL